MRKAKTPLKVVASDEEIKVAAVFGGVTFFKTLRSKGYSVDQVRFFWSQFKDSFESTLNNALAEVGLEL